jgi:UDP-N-acetylglucosamine:LPS N-acetylglucosamine transferase
VFTDTTRPPNVLILTAPIGRGHKAVARALFQSLRGEGASVRVRSPMLHCSRLRRLPWIYDSLTRSAPSLWSAYYNARQRKVLRNLNSIFVRGILRKALEVTLSRHEYDIVVVTHSLYCHCIHDLAQQLRTVVVVTDLFDGPEEWFLRGAHQYVVPTAYMHEVAMSKRIAADSIAVCRLPTEALKDDRSPQALQGAKRVLVVGGSGGIGPVEAVARGIADSHVPTHVTVASGTNRRLANRLKRLASTTLEPTPYVPFLARSLSRFDVVVTKPGSIALMEVLDAGVPFVLMPGIPGIESGNTRELVDSKIPIASSERSARQIFERLFSPRGRLTSDGEVWHANIRGFAAKLPLERPTRAGLCAERSGAYPSGAELSRR